MKTWCPINGNDLERFIFMYWDWFNPDGDESIYGFDCAPLVIFSYETAVRNSKLAKEIAEILKGDYPYGSPDFLPYTIAKDLAEGYTGLSAQFDEVWALVYMMQSLGMIVVEDILDDERGQVHYVMHINL